MQAIESIENPHNKCYLIVSTLNTVNNINGQIFMHIVWRNKPDIWQEDRFVHKK